MIDTAIEYLIDDKNLDNTAIKEVFDEIFSGLCDVSQICAFITALKIKNITPDIVASALISANDTFKNNRSEIDETSVSNVVLNKENNNYLDIFLAVDFILASTNLNVYKHSFLPSLRAEKSFDILNLMGFKLDTTVSDDIAESNFIYQYLSYDTPFLKYTKDIYRNIKFDSILNFIYKMLNPYKVKNVIISASQDKNIDDLAHICLDLNYSNSLIISNNSPCPYVSIEGDTNISEAWKNKIFTYVINPELFEIKQDSIEKLKCENLKHNADTLKDIFDNKIKDCRYDAVIINAGLALYITKKAASIVDGIDLAKKVLDDGIVKSKFEQIKKIYS